MKWLLIFIPCLCIALPRPIQFGIPECKIVKEIPKKDRDFAFINSNDLRTYIYTEEADYYQDYQRSFFAVTSKKGGWDCLRHYEILACGCIPYFPNLEKCPKNTMAFYPKQLIQEAMHLEGVSYMRIDHSKFNLAKYYDILNRLIAYTREHLTSRKMGEYLLKSSDYSGTGKILFLTEDPGPDYLRCLTLVGLKECLGNRVVDVPKIEHIYKSYPGDIKKLYGKGFTYTRIVEDHPVDRSNIEDQIRNKEFELIIYGSIHRGLRHFDLVQENYPEEKILYICGEDGHYCEYCHVTNLFLREWE